MSLRGLRRRGEFLAANGGRRTPMPAFVLLVRPRGDGDPAIGMGFTVTKKIGGAVARNRIKRRFRALAREVLPEAGISGADHVLIGRTPALERDFALLGADLRKALAKCARPASAHRQPELVSGSTVRPGPIGSVEPNGGSRNKPGMTVKSSSAIEPR